MGCAPRMEVGDIRGRVDFGIITIREDELSPRWLLVVGIGGGAPAPEFTLGDVVVATEVCDFNVGAVLKDGSREYALHGWMSHPEVAKLVANLPAVRKQLGAWNSAESVACARPDVKVSSKALSGGARWKKKLKDVMEDHVAEGRREPKVTAGAIACSDLVVKDAELFQVWLKFARHVIAVEMESAGIHKAAQALRVGTTLGAGGTQSGPHSRERGGQVTDARPRASPEVGGRRGRWAPPRGRWAPQYPRQRAATEGGGRGWRGARPGGRGARRRWATLRLEGGGLLQEEGRRVDDERRAAWREGAPPGGRRTR